MDVIFATLLGLLVLSFIFLLLHFFPPFLFSIRSQNVNYLIPFDCYCTLTFRLAHAVRRYYPRFKFQKYFGIVHFNRRYLVITDGETCVNILQRVQKGASFRLSTSSFNNNNNNNNWSNYCVAKGELLGEYEWPSELLGECGKELAILLEAKANRKMRVDLPSVCFKHACNVLGVCVFGLGITRLTNSKCRFYEMCEKLNSAENMRKPEAQLHHYFKELICRLTREEDNSTKCLITFLFQMRNTHNSAERVIEALTCFGMKLCAYVLSTLPEMMCLALIEVSASEQYVRHNGETDLHPARLSQQIISGNLVKYPVIPLVYVTCTETICEPNTKLHLQRNTNLILPCCCILRDFLTAKKETDENQKTAEQPALERLGELLLEVAFDSDSEDYSKLASQFVLTSAISAISGLLEKYTFERSKNSDWNIDSCEFSKARKVELPEIRVANARKQQ